MAQPKTQREPKTIRIIKGHPSKVDKDPVEVWKNKDGNDRVEWSGPGDWLVVFNDASPFDRDYFTPADPETADIVGEGGGREYKYTVYVDGKRGADPIIIVRP